MEMDVARPAASPGLHLAVIMLRLDSVSSKRHEQAGQPAAAPPVLSKRLILLAKEVCALRISALPGALYLENRNQVRQLAIAWVRETVCEQGRRICPLAEPEQLTGRSGAFRAVDQLAFDKDGCFRGWL